MTKQQLEIISQAIAHAILEGQNQIYDLKEGRATGDEVNKRMQASYDFHYKNVVDALTPLHPEPLTTKSND